MLRFEDFFDLAEIQKIQDSFALASGVASVFTTPEGVPLTRPSESRRLCRDVVRATEKGCRNCIQSDSMLCAHRQDGPTIRRCKSGGLWDAGVSITVDGRHVANWIIGQVRCTRGDDEQLLGYARAIGADPDLFREALAEVPFMEAERFRHVADCLFIIANSLCEKAYQQAQLLREKKERQARDTMRRMLMDRSRDGIAFIDEAFRIMESNRRFAGMLGYGLDEIGRLHVWDFEADLDETAIRERFSDFSDAEALFETRHRRRDGSVFDVEISTAGVTIGEESCIIAICRDISGRKESERRLRQSEEHFRALFELSQDGFILADPEGRFLNANSAYCRMTGYSLPELRALGDFYAITPERWVGWQRSEIWEKRLLQTGDTGIYRKEYIHKEGHTFPVELRDFGVFDEQGRMRHSWGIVRDISARQATEERMNMLMQMVEQSPACIVMTDPAGHIEYVNLKFTQVSGYTLEDVRGRTPGILGSGRKTREEYEELWRTITSGRQWRGEFHNRHKDGSFYWESALISPVIDSEGRVTHFVAVKEDITQRRQVERELRKQELGFKKILDILPQFVAYLDRDLRFRFVNPAFAAMSAGGDPTGLTLPELVGPHAFARAGRLIEAALRGTAGHFTASMTFPGVGERFLDGHLIPDYSEDGVSGFYAVLNDLSHLKKVEESLRRAKDDAEAANKLKSEFLANMSHEIRTPLNGIAGMLRIIQATALGREQREYVQTALKSSERLTQLLSDILDISQIEADRLVIHNRSFDMAGIEHALEELFSKPIKGNARLSYSFSCSPMVPRQLIGDEARLMQVLFNLVGNSLKFTDSGSVNVTVSVLPFSFGSAARLLFTVVDTGPGISEEMQHDIFEPFIQSDGSYTRRYQGVGLGLTIVRKLVRRMGGTLCLESLPGEGTSVYLSLPFGLPADARHTRAEEPPVPEPAAGPLRLLMVEDESVNLLCGRRLLESLGHQVLVARNGQEALDTLLAGDLDLVLMDIQMPVLDGIQATRAIRRDRLFSHVADIPIIALTAHAMAGDKEKFLAAGMDGYLSKPYDIRNIEQEIARVWKARRPGRMCRAASGDGIGAHRFAG